MTLKVGHRHHAELLPHVDALRMLADEITGIDGSALDARLGTELDFIREQLIPHMEMAEQNLYPELNRLLEDPRAMEPMQREHQELRRLVTTLQGSRDRLSGGPVSIHDELVLRRLLYRLFVLIRVHLAEEERYLAIIDRHADDPERASLIAGMNHAVLERL